MVSVPVCCTSWHGFDSHQCIKILSGSGQAVGRCDTRIESDDCEVTKDASRGSTLVLKPSSEVIKTGVPVPRKITYFIQFFKSILRCFLY